MRRVEATRPSPFNMNNDKILKLTSPMPPSVNHYMAPRVFYRGKKPNVTMYEKPEAKIYKKEFADYIKTEATRQGWEPSLDKFQHYYCDCVFYFKQTDQDPNNYFKLLMDAITDSKRVWVDDNVSLERVQGIFYDRDNPRIELTIRPVDYVGIFPNREHLERFRDRCFHCRRYLEGRCSILRKATEGRIQECIRDEQCDNYKEAKKNGK